MQMGSWQELANPRDLTKIFTTPEYAAWRSLRESEDSRYLGLAMPRFLARIPYGAKTDPVEEFDFEEDTGAADHTRYAWANSAYAMATNITRSFKLFGWCSRIRGVESGGAVEGLPVHTFPTDDGGVDMKCPTEIAISDRREAELAKNGFMPLLHRKNSDFAAFIGAQSLQKPTEYDDPDATANANLAARLPYLFACCRFAHYLKCIVRDKIGSFKERDDMHRWLNNWIMNYVDGDPANSSETDEGTETAGGGRSRGRGSRGQPRLLLGEVLSSAALPARRVDGFAAAGLEAAVGEGTVGQVSSVCTERVVDNVDDGGGRTSDQGDGRASRLFSETRSQSRRRSQRTRNTKARSSSSRGVLASRTRPPHFRAAARVPANQSPSTSTSRRRTTRASPRLAQAVAMGDHFKSAILTVRKVRRHAAGISDHHAERRVHLVLSSRRVGRRQAADGAAVAELLQDPPGVQGAEGRRLARRLGQARVRLDQTGQDLTRQRSTDSAGVVRLWPSTCS